MFSRYLDRARTAGLFSFWGLSTLLFANPSTSETYRHQLQLSVEYSSNLIIESIDKEALLEETGDLLNYRLGYRKTFANNIFLGVDLEQGSGTLDWDGYSQANFRYQTQTEYYTSHYRFLFGRQNPRYSSYLGLGYHFRERNILTKRFAEGGKIDGLYEELEWLEVFGGYDFYFYQSPKQHFKLYGELAASILAELHVEFSGKYDSATIKPGQIVAFEGGFEYFFDFNDGWGLSMKPGYRYTYMDKSKSEELTQNGQSIGASFNQPVTEFQELYFELGLSKRLP